MIYMILFVLCIIAELSPRINTDNFIKKIGIGFILVGCLIENAVKQYSFIEIGLIIYFSVEIWSAYCSDRKRRGYDA